MQYVPPDQVHLLNFVHITNVVLFDGTENRDLTTHLSIRSSPDLYRLIFRWFRSKIREEQHWWKESWEHACGEARWLSVAGIC